MKSITLMTTALFLSFSVFANDLSSSDSLKLAEELKAVQTMEELGEIISAQCEYVDFQDIICEFKYELPEDYCWYGHFEAMANYVVDNHGALELNDYEIKWVK